MFCFSHAKGSLDTNLVNRACDKLGCSAKYSLLHGSLAALREIETNVDELWAKELGPALSLKLVSFHLDAMSLAQHGQTDIQHKAFVGILVPNNRLLKC